MNICRSLKIRLLMILRCCGLRVLCLLVVNLRRTCLLRRCLFGVLVVSLVMIKILGVGLVICGRSRRALARCWISLNRRSLLILLLMVVILRISMIFLRSLVDLEISVLLMHCACRLLVGSLLGLSLMIRSVILLKRILRTVRLVRVYRCCDGVVGSVTYLADLTLLVRLWLLR